MPNINLGPSSTSNANSTAYYPATPVSTTNAQQALIAKIRSSIAAANVANPVDLQPWLPPLNINTGGNATRANATAYPVNYVFANAGATHQFVVRVAGTTAGAEPATVTNPVSTTNPYNLGDIADGTATLTWIGPVRTTTALSGAPTMSSGALPADVTVFQFLTDGTSIYSFARYWGGTGSTIGGGAYSGGIFVRGSSTSPGSRSPIFTGNYTTAQTSYMEFWTDSPHFCISVCGQASSGWTRGQSITVEIDGRRLFDGAVTPLTDFGANNYLTFDFRASGGQKSRRIRVMGAFSFFNAGYYFLATRGQDSIWQQPNPNRYRLAIVGDSLYGVTASGPLIPGFDRAKLLADFIGCDDIVNLSVGGTGFIANASGVGLNYAARITDLVTANPSIIWIGGALNDVVGTYTSAQRRAAALSYLQQVRQLLPNAMIIMGGTVGNTNSLANNQTIEGDCFAAVDTFGDSNTYKIPASTATYPWLTGTGTLQGVTGVGNNDIYIGPTDTTHPSHTAIQYLARQDAVAFSNLISTL